MEEIDGLAFLSALRDALATEEGKRLAVEILGELLLLDTSSIPPFIGELMQRSTAFRHFVEGRAGRKWAARALASVRHDPP